MDLVERIKPYPFNYVNSELLSDPLKMEQSAYVSFMIFLDLTIILNQNR